MSLVEATIILAVLAILTSVLAPAIGGYVAEARSTEAAGDVAAIGTALTRMLGDVGETFVLRDGNGATAADPPARDSTNVVELLASAGTVPGVATVRSTAGSDWDDAIDGAAVQSLEHHLVVNTPSATSANRYRVASDMTASIFDPSGGGTFNSPVAWRGAYLPGPIGPDPWGRRYGINVDFLERALGTATGQVNDVFVVSAGQNGVVDIRFDTDGVTAAVDDLVYVVSGGTR